MRIIAAAFAAFLVACSSLAHAADDIVLTPQRVSEHVWFFQGATGVASAANKGFMSNAGFVVTPDGVVAFDALGTPALGRAMVTAIAAVTRAPVRRVVVSHYRADHTFDVTATAMGRSFNAKGTWKIDDKGQLCRTYETAPPGMPNPLCIPAEPHKIGDSWSVTFNGRARTMTLKAGVE